MLEARRVLVATGVSDELPDIPGVRERWGRDLLHCPYCHGWEVRDQPLGVLGTLPGSVEHAQLVRQWSDDVVFFAHTYELDRDRARRAWRRAGSEVVDGEVARLVVEDDRLTGVELADGRGDRADGGVRPTRQRAARRRPAGRPRLRASTRPASPRSTRTGRTSAPGVWAAGNVVDPRAQVITSAGAGSAAAIAINADLVQEDVDVRSERRAMQPNGTGPFVRSRRIA